MVDLAPSGELRRLPDLEYWCIDELTMEPCCALKYYPQIDVCQSEKDGDIAAKKLEVLSVINSIMHLKLLL